MIGGVTALPIRANECTIPCANPQLPAASNWPSRAWPWGSRRLRRIPAPAAARNSEANPVTAPVRIVDIPTIAQQIASVSRGPSLSPIQPPIN